MDSNDSDSDKSEATQKSNKGYSKRPLWQWIIIYIVVAFIVYGLIYLVFIYSHGNKVTSHGY